MKTEFEKYAQRSGTIASLIGLVVGYLCIAILFGLDDGIIKGLRWGKRLDDIWPNLTLGCTGMVLTAYWITGRKLNPNNVFAGTLTGAAFALVSLFLGTIVGSTLGFLQEAHFESWPEQLPDNLFDYYVKPLFWIALFGTLPAAIIGGIWGALLHHKQKRGPKPSY